MDTIHPSASDPFVRRRGGVPVLIPTRAARLSRRRRGTAAMTREGSDLTHFRKRPRAARPDAADSNLRRAQTTALHALNATRIARSWARNLNRVSGDILAAGLTSEAGVSLFVVGTRQFLAAGARRDGRKTARKSRATTYEYRPLSLSHTLSRRASTTSGRRRRRRRDARYIDTRIVSVAYRSSRDRASSRADAHAGPPFSTHSWRKTGDGEKTPSLDRGRYAALHPLRGVARADRARDSTRLDGGGIDRGPHPADRASRATHRARTDHRKPSDRAWELSFPSVPASPTPLRPRSFSSRV